MSDSSNHLRILAAVSRWPGSNAEGAYNALQRQGHSVYPVQEGLYFPFRWRTLPMKIVRRLTAPLLARELHSDILRLTAIFRPHLFFAFKGSYISARTLQALGELGVIRINWYPDVSFYTHGKYLPSALPLYDWVFSAKTFGIDDMREKLGISRSSVLLHGYDPDIHFPHILSEEERAHYGCDVSFIGTWSPKKQHLLEHLVAARPDLDVKIWGNQWDRAQPGALDPAIQGKEIIGREYAKAIVGSRINLAILSERRTGASSGDLITSRSFHIPAARGFMLHERTTELLHIFREDRDIACFSTPDDLVEKVENYGGNQALRERMAASAHDVCTRAHSLDERVKTILGKYSEIKDQRRAQLP